MKKLILCLTVLLLLFTACEKTPKDVKPIDWENYNDVYTVYWNCYSTCKKIKKEYDDKTIKIAGWKMQGTGKFLLCNDIKCAGSFFVPEIGINFNFPEPQVMLDSSDLTKKCFIKGKIWLRMGKLSSGCYVFPEIKVMDINDIYFE
jgi:hypothetical protein